MATTINQLTVEEFQKHFNRLPVNYKKGKAGIEYVTFSISDTLKRNSAKESFSTNHQQWCS